MNITTQTVNQICIIPPIGTVIGACTIASNITKLVASVVRATFLKIAAAYYSVTKAIDKQKIKQEQLNQVHIDQQQYIKFIAIGILRLVPILGGYILHCEDMKDERETILNQKPQNNSSTSLATNSSKTSTIPSTPQAKTIKGGFKTHKGVINVKTSIDIDKLKTAAQSGDITAQMELADAYYRGIGIPQSDQQAFNYYLSAAKAGNSEAQNFIAYMYRHKEGTGSISDTEASTEAFKWLEKAAVSGYHRAQYNLGFFYKEGYGTKQSNAQAAEWYFKSAMKGYARAKEALIDLIKHASDIDPNQCYKGVDQTNKEACKAIAKMQLEIAKKIHNLKKDHQVYFNEKALPWLKSAAKHHYVPAIEYVHHEFVNSDKELVLEFFKIGAEAQDTKYEYLYGHTLYNHAKNLRETNSHEAETLQKQAIAFVQKAADKNWSAAQFNLGNVYLKKADQHRKHKQIAEEQVAAEQAYNWYLQAIKNSGDKPNIECLIRIADLLKNGRGVTRSESEASKYYRQASEMGVDMIHMFAKTQLALLQLGKASNATANLKEAFELLKTADHPFAKSQLAKIYAEGFLGIQESSREEAARLYWEAAEDALKKGGLDESSINKCYHRAHAQGSFVAGLKYSQRYFKKLSTGLDDTFKVNEEGSIAFGILKDIIDNQPIYQAHLSSKGIAEAKCLLAKFYRNGYQGKICKDDNSVAPVETPEQLAERLKNLAKQLLEEAHAEGCLEATVDLGLLHRSENQKVPAPHSYTEYERLIKEAAAQRHPKGLHYLGELHMDTYNILNDIEDRTLALRYLKEADSLGYPHSEPLIRKIEVEIQNALTLPANYGENTDSNTIKA